MLCNIHVSLTLKNFQKLLNSKCFVYDVLDEHEKALIGFEKTFVQYNPNNVQALKLKGDSLLIRKIQ